MAAQLDIKEGLQRALHVTVPAAAWHQKTAELLQKRVKTAKIQGFRPGKAPLNVVKQHYGASIAEQALDEVISKHLFEACKEVNVNPITRPTIEALKAELDQDVAFTALFEIEPVIEAVNFKGVELERTVSEVTDADIDKVIDNLAARMGAFSAADADTVAALTHRLTFDFEGFIDNVPFDGGKAEGFQLVLGEGRMIPGFEDALLGLKAGDTKRIQVTFPSDYHEALAGKDAEFDIKVHQIEVHAPMKVSEDFCRAVGVADGQIATLKQEIRTTLERELAKTLRNKLREQAFNKLIEVNSLDVPKAEVHDEVHQLMNNAKERFKEMTGGKGESPDFPHSMFEDEALKRVKIGYLVRALIQLNKIEVNDADVRALAEELAGPYEKPSEVIQYHMDNKERHQQLKALAMEYKVVQHLLDLAVVTEKFVPHAELLPKSA